MKQKLLTVLSQTSQDIFWINLILFIQKAVKTTRETKTRQVIIDRDFRTTQPQNMIRVRT